MNTLGDAECTCFGRSHPTGKRSYTATTVRLAGRVGIMSTKEVAVDNTEAAVKDTSTRVRTTDLAVNSTESALVADAKAVISKKWVYCC